ncbi:hypothetical protein [Chitinophaga deserti]|uniref:hypothetical protein n=1 Tax=Chitinophaga deserti TaxID=2164099 RepID=UPI000D6B5693|nr:hypothetical protein [Chitinophaga deserti]
MKLVKFFAFTLGAAVALSSCRNNDTDDEDLTPDQPTTLSGEQTTSKTLTNDKVWTLKGYVYFKEGTTLTIQEGTIIKSDITEKGALIIERGAKIFATGTAAKPIVFTSGKAAGQRNPGDWGGIIILGRAKTNRSTEPQIEGGVGRPYGGNDDDDNSGILKYVRIEYAGIAAQPNSEINALTLGAVGRGTVIDHVMTSYANDDAFEFFGGTVSPTHLVAYGTADDDFDFDFGYRGTVQYAVALRIPTFVDPGDAGNGIECDNDGSSTQAEPFTHPVISNMTIIGPNNAAGTASNHNYGNRWRRSTRFTFLNSIILGSQKGGLSVESKSSYDAFNAGTSSFRNNIVFAVTKPFTTDSATARILTGAQFPADPITKDVQGQMIAAAALLIKAKAEAAGQFNLVAANADAVGLNDPFNLTTPNFLPKAGTPALTGTFQTATGIKTENFRGAFGTENWMAGWAVFNPNQQAY